MFRIINHGNDVRMRKAPGYSYFVAKPGDRRVLIATPMNE